ncbi:hypothetical protein Ancab_035476, partial [Ancistrocladus abbreviatus]
GDLTSGFLSALSEVNGQRGQRPLQAPAGRFFARLHSSPPKPCPLSVAEERK